MTTTPKVRVIFIPVDERPRVVEIPGGQAQLRAMQELVGGYIERAPFGEVFGQGLDLWCNEDGHALGLPINGTVSVGVDTFIVGNAFLARHDREGDLASVTDEDIQCFNAKYFCGVL